MPRSVGCAFVVGMFAVCACSPGTTTRASSSGFPHHDARASSQPAGVRSVPQSSACPAVSPTSQWEPGSALIEIHGTGYAAELWALTEPLIAQRDVKIVWRMTGTGTLRLVAVDTRGARVEPRERPSPHGGSTWDRPGDEWGTIFFFPSPGCWTIEAQRDSGSGRLVVEVAAS